MLATPCALPPCSGAARRLVPPLCAPPPRAPRRPAPRRPATPNTDLFFSVLVPAPKQLTLERQLNKSVLIGWNHPDNCPPGAIDSYLLYVDGVLKATVKATERTRALVEGVDSNRVSDLAVHTGDGDVIVAADWSADLNAVR